MIAQAGAAGRLHAGILHRELKRLAHDVMLSERLLARVRHGPGDAVHT